MPEVLTALSTESSNQEIETRSPNSPDSAVPRRTSPVRGQLVSERIKLFSHVETNVSTFLPRQKDVISAHPSPKYMSSTISPQGTPITKNKEHLFYHKPGTNFIRSNTQKSIHNLSISGTNGNNSVIANPSPLALSSSPAGNSSVLSSFSPSNNLQNVRGVGSVSSLIETFDSISMSKGESKPDLSGVRDGSKKSNIDETEYVINRESTLKSEITPGESSESSEDVAKETTAVEPEIADKGKETTLEYKDSISSKDVTDLAGEESDDIYDIVKSIRAAKDDDSISSDDSDNNDYRTLASVTMKTPVKDSSLPRNLRGIPLPELPIPAVDANERIRPSSMAETLAGFDYPSPTKSLGTKSEKVNSVNYGTLKRKLFLDDGEQNFQSALPSSYRDSYITADAISFPSDLNVPTKSSSATTELKLADATAEPVDISMLNENVEELLKLNMDTLAELDLGLDLQNAFENVLRSTLTVGDSPATITSEDNHSGAQELTDFRGNAIATLVSLSATFSEESEQLLEFFSGLLKPFDATENKARFKYESGIPNSKLDAALTIFMRVSGSLDSIYKFAGQYVGVNILQKCGNLLNVCVESIKGEYKSTGYIESLSELDKCLRNTISAVNIVLTLFKNELRALPVSFEKGFVVEATSFGSQYAPTESNMNQFYGAYELEYFDYGSTLYKTVFAVKKHENYIGYISALGGPVIVSLLSNELPTGTVEYWAILRKLDKPDIRLVLTPPEIPGIKRLSKQEKKLVLLSLDPELAYSKLTRVVDQTLEKKLIALDTANIQQKFKFGIVYGGKDQSTEEEMLNNEVGSSSFDTFLNIIGDHVLLKGFKGFNAGLDTRSSLTGDKSIYTVFKDFEIMFHVSTLLPYQKDDIQQIARKRHIGNDIATIVFLDENSTIDLTTFKSQFLHVFIIIREDRTSHPEEIGYRVSIVRNSDVPPFGPSLPTPPIFYDAASLRNFILAKLINGECASYCAPKFAGPHTRTRHALIDDMLNTYASPQNNIRKSDASDSSRSDTRDSGSKDPLALSNTPPKYDMRKPVFLGRLRRKSSNNLDPQTVTKSAVITRGHQMRSLNSSGTSTDLITASSEVALLPNEGSSYFSNSVDYLSTSSQTARDSGRSHDALGY